METGYENADAEDGDEEGKAKAHEVIQKSGITAWDEERKAALAEMLKKEGF
jgi:hypothetical protein